MPEKFERGFEAEVIICSEINFLPIWTERKATKQRQTNTSVTGYLLCGPVKFLAIKAIIKFVGKRVRTASFEFRITGVRASCCVCVYLMLKSQFRCFNLIPII